VVSGGTSEETKGVSNTGTLFLVSLRPANERSGTGCKKGIEGLSIGAVESVRVGGPGCLLVVIHTSKKTREPFANRTSDCRVSMSLRTVGVGVGVAGAIWVISVVSTVGRIVVGVFALGATFTFVWRRFIRSGVVPRIEVLVYDFFNVH